MAASSTSTLTRYEKNRQRSRGLSTDSSTPPVTNNIVFNRSRNRFEYIPPQREYLPAQRQGRAPAEIRYPPSSIGRNAKARISARASWDSSSGDPRHPRGAESLPRGASSRDRENGQLSGSTGRSRGRIDADWGFQNGIRGGGGMRQRSQSIPDLVHASLMSEEDQDRHPLGARSPGPSESFRKEKAARIQRTGNEEVVVSDRISIKVPAYEMNGDDDSDESVDSSLINDLYDDIRGHRGPSVAGYYDRQAPHQLGQLVKGKYRSEPSLYYDDSAERLTRSGQPQRQRQGRSGMEAQNGVPLGGRVDEGMRRGGGMKNGEVTATGSRPVSSQLDRELAARTIVLTRGKNGYGFSLLCSKGPAGGRSLESISEDDAKRQLDAPRPKYPRIKEVSKNSIAEKAGLLPLDLLIEINKKDVAYASNDQCFELIGLDSDVVSLKVYTPPRESVVVADRGSSVSVTVRDSHSSSSTSLAAAGGMSGSVSKLSRTDGIVVADVIKQHTGAVSASSTTDKSVVPNAQSKIENTRSTLKSEQFVVESRNLSHLASTSSQNRQSNIYEELNDLDFPVLDSPLQLQTSRPANTNGLPTAQATIEIGAVQQQPTSVLEVGSMTSLDHVSTDQAGGLYKRGSSSAFIARNNSNGGHVSDGESGYGTVSSKTSFTSLTGSASSGVNTLCEQDEFLAKILEGSGEENSETLGNKAIVTTSVSTTQHQLNKNEMLPAVKHEKWSYTAGPLGKSGSAGQLEKFVNKSEKLGKSSVPPPVARKPKPKVASSSNDQISTSQEPMNNNNMMLSPGTDSEDIYQNINGYAAGENDDVFLESRSDVVGQSSERPSLPGSHSSPLLNKPDDPPDFMALTKQILSQRKKAVNSMSTPAFGVSQTAVNNVSGPDGNTSKQTLPERRVPSETKDVDSVKRISGAFRLNSSAQLPFGTSRTPVASGQSVDNLRSTGKANIQISPPSFVTDSKEADHLSHNINQTQPTAVVPLAISANIEAIKNDSLVASTKNEKKARPPPVAKKTISPPTDVIHSPEFQISSNSSSSALPNQYVDKSPATDLQSEASATQILGQVSAAETVKEYGGNKSMYTRKQPAGFLAMRRHFRSSHTKGLSDGGTEMSDGDEHVFSDDHISESSSMPVLRGPVPRSEQEKANRRLLGLSVRSLTHLMDNPVPPPELPDFGTANADPKGVTLLDLIPPPPEEFDSIPVLKSSSTTDVSEPTYSQVIRSYNLGASPPPSSADSASAFDAADPAECCDARAFSSSKTRLEMNGSIDKVPKLGSSKAPPTAPKTKPTTMIGSDISTYANKQPGTWSTTDVAHWLRDQQLGQYCDAFKGSLIDGRRLVDVAVLGREHLIALGMTSMEHRRNFDRARSKLQRS